jgi:hypothetical protein
MAAKPDALAGIVGSITEQLPDGVECVIFLLTDVGPAFEAVCASSTTPDVFAPVLRRWLERFDAGDAGGHMVRLDG